MTFAGPASSLSGVVSSFYLFVWRSPTQSRLALSFSTMELDGWGRGGGGGDEDPLLTNPGGSLTITE